MYANLRKLDTRTETFGRPANGSSASKPRPPSVLKQDLMPGLTWDHTEDIALALYEKHPEVDPIHIRYTDLHKWITALEEFGDDPTKSTEGKLEAIQMAWVEEYQEDHA